MEAMETTTAPSKGHAKKALPENKKLTAFQERFCLCVIANNFKNNSRAYTEAGGKAKNPAVAAVAAYRLIHEPHIARYIERAREAIMARRQIQAEDVVRDLEKLKDHAMGVDPITISRTVKTTTKDKDGNDVVTRTEVDYQKRIFDAGAAARALELLGRHTGGFKESHDHNLTINPIRQLLDQVATMPTSTELVRKK